MGILDYTKMYTPDLWGNYSCNRAPWEQAISGNIFHYDITQGTIQIMGMLTHYFPSSWCLEKTKSSL